SANFLYGGRLYLPPALSEAFRRYRFKKPTASIGYSLLVFKLDPSEPEIYNDTGVVFANKEALSAAEILFAQTLRMDPRNARAHFNLARALTAQKRLDEAETHYREGLAIDPESAEAHHDRGRNWAAQGKSEAALEEFSQALRLKPDFVEAHESLSRLFRRQGRIDEAIKHSQEALRLLRLTQSMLQTPCGRHQECETRKRTREKSRDRGRGSGKPGSTASRHLAFCRRLCFYRYLPSHWCQRISTKPRKEPAASFHRRTLVPWALRQLTGISSTR